MFCRTLFAGVLALAALGAGPASAQEDCRLGDEGCSPAGASIEVKEESFKPRRTVAEGDPVELLVALKCEGAAAMAPTDLHFLVVPAAWLPGVFNGSDAHWKTLTGKGRNIGTFEVPEQQCRFWRQVRFTTATVGEHRGSYYVTACLDTDLIADPRERCVAPLEVTVQPRPRPDITVSMSLDKLEATSSDTVNITITARNVGDADMEEGFIDVLWSRDRLWDGRGDHRIQLLELQPLAQSQTWRTTVPHPIDAGRGEIFYHACARGVMGPGGKAEERALVNNCTDTFSLTVR